MNTPHSTTQKPAQRPQMCPMHCGNPAHVCKARGRCVYVVTDLRTQGEAR